MFIFDGCHCSWAAVPPVKYEHDIQASVLKMVNNRENNGTEEISLVTQTPTMIEVRAQPLCQQAFT